MKACDNRLIVSLYAAILFLLIILAGGCAEDSIWDNISDAQGTKMLLALNLMTGKYTTGGTISNLTGSGLQLQNNLSNTISVPALRTTFTFTAALRSGDAYNVTVLTQPSGQTCTVSNGSGTVTGANVTDVAITCTP